MVYSKHRLAWRQTWALCTKNAIVLSRHWIINIFRCLILPVAYAIFFSKATVFFSEHNELGLGSPNPIRPLDPYLNSLKLVWVPPPAALLNDAANNFVEGFMSKVLSSLDSSARVVRIDNATDVENECPENFSLRSDCFGAVVIETLQEGSDVFVYTLRGDGGNVYVNVKDHKSDLETKVLPLQWALDSTFLATRTGSSPHTPQEWPFTQESNAEQAESNRQLYLSGINSLIVLALFLNFLGVVYHLPGSIASERAAQLTSHMEAMGLLKRAKIISWHFSISTLYLPAWMITAILWKTFIFSKTSAGLIIVFFLIVGWSLASWTFLIAAPFAKIPTLAAISAVFLAIVFNIIALIAGDSVVTSIVLSFIFPPSIFTFVMRRISRFELDGRGASWTGTVKGTPLSIIVFIVIAIIDAIIFPLLAIWLEKRLYGVNLPGYQRWYRRWTSKRQVASLAPLPDDVAVRLEGLSKTFVSRSWWSCGGRARRNIAIESLSLDFPRGVITVLLGRNGAAKSTTLGIMSGLLSADRGQMQMGSGGRKLGIAPQQNVLWDELTCRQHITLWTALKAKSKEDMDPVDDLLDRADLAGKKGRLSSALSGGQRRKLQLAIALCARSELLALDEVTTGCDPLSRHALWKVILGCKGRATVILTTHFLDEADILGDQIAILKAPGRLLGMDSPTAWKTGKFSEGYSIKVSSPEPQDVLEPGLVSAIVKVVPKLHISRPRPGELVVWPLKTELEVAQVLQTISQTHPASTLQYDVQSTSLESVFLAVTQDEDTLAVVDSKEGMGQVVSAVPSGSSTKDLDVARHGTDFALSTEILTLSSGRAISLAAQALVIAIKRFMTLRRTYLMPLIGIVMVCCASLIPTGFIRSRNQTCARIYVTSTSVPLTLPLTQFRNDSLVVAPGSILQSLQGSSVLQHPNNVTPLDPGSAFNQYIENTYRNLSYGGLSIDQQSGVLIAYEAGSLSNAGPSLLNLASNILLNEATGSTGYNIISSYSYFAVIDFSSLFQAIKFLAFYSLGFACFAAFFTLSPTAERRLGVKSNLFANGVRPIAYWSGQLLADFWVFTLASVIVTVALAVITKGQFNGIALLWLCMELYGVAGALFAYTFSLFLSSSLAAWAIVAGWNVIWFLLYLAADLLLLTYDKSANAGKHLTVVYFTMGIISPVIPLIRAALVSLNVFSLLCDGLGNRTSAPYSSMTQFGGPILYLCLWIIACFVILVYVDSGRPVSRWVGKGHRVTDQESSVESDVGTDVDAERKMVVASGSDLRVEGLYKAYGRETAVRNVTFQVNAGETFALIGPNGAGKTTTLSCIQGLLSPTSGDIFLRGHSIVDERNAARASIGICPQINPFDDMSVRDHLYLYGLLKGVKKSDLKVDIRTLIAKTGLTPYQKLRAGELSGGNKRKLCLAIAMMGSPPILLVDEFSSGVDSYSRRENYALLKAMTTDKAVIFTTHSMEEVEAMADRVGVLAERLLAIGTVDQLKRRFSSFEIHLTSDKVNECLEFVTTSFPGARKMLQSASRFEVPVEDGSIAHLFAVMAEAKERLNIKDMTIQRMSMETTFIKIIEQYGVREEGEGDLAPKKRRPRRCG